MTLISPPRAMEIEELDVHEALLSKLASLETEANVIRATIVALRYPA